MQDTDAETLALKALTFLVREGEMLDRFLAFSGIHPEDLRERAGDPLLLAAVLDFVLGDDKLLLAFAQDEAVDTKLVHAARRALPGAAPEM
jgi:Protein of unknown function (DUF3572)